MSINKYAPVDINFDYKDEWVTTTYLIENEFVGSMSILNVFKFNNPDMEDIAWKKSGNKKENLLINIGLLHARIDELHRLWNMAIEYYYFFNCNGISDSKLARALSEATGKTTASWNVWLGNGIGMPISDSITTFKTDNMRLLFIAWCDHNIGAIALSLKKNKQLLYDGENFLKE